MRLIRLDSWLCFCVVVPGNAQSGADGRVVFLHPADRRASTAFVSSGDWQDRGFSEHFASGHHHAFLLDTDTQTYVDLHPPKLTWSECFATDGPWQSGWAAFPSTVAPLRAVL